MQAPSDFRVLRALGLACRAWLRNLVPFTLLTAALYAPVFVWAARVEVEPDAVLESLFLWPMLLVTGLAIFLAPMLTYRVVQDLRGVKVSMRTSMKHGVRGILPAIFLAIAAGVLRSFPGGGGLLAVIVTSIYFVAAPAAVAERLGWLEAFTRSSELTAGRRLRIFALSFLLEIVGLVMMLAWVLPAIEDATIDPASAKPTALIAVAVVGLLHMFGGIVAAVSYALLRQDKDGLSPEQLARVFE